MGYYIDDVYVPRRVYKCFCNKEPTIETEIRGKPPSSACNYRLLLQRMRSNNLILNNVVFLPIDKQDIHGVESSFWKLNFIEQYFYYTCIADNKIIGYISTKEDIYYNSQVYLNMIETLKKDKGYGSKIIKSLLDLVDIIKGLSLYNSLDFWEKVGAIIGKDNYFQLKGVKK